MKRFFPHWIALALISAAFSSASYAQKLLPTGNTISFTSKQMGVNVEGSFKRFEAQVAFDPKKPEAGKVGFTIDLTSVDIGDAGTMAELKKPGWFDSARVPAAIFASTGIKSVGPGKFEILGNLTVKGIAKPVVLHKSKPQDFEKSEQIVLIGKIKDDVFHANDILMKCPSKYNDQKPQVN